jgi:hypothetical protein
LEDDFEDMFTEKFPLMFMGGQSTPSSMHRRGAGTSIGVSRDLINNFP